MTLTSSLSEEEIIKLLWAKIGTPEKRDPFNDDAAWVSNNSSKFVVVKSDMLVSSTDVPKRMTLAQMARKAIVSCVSDFAAKGVKPSFCVISLGLQRKMDNRQHIDQIASGLAAAQREFGFRIVGGDVNATLADQVIDCAVIGFADKLVKRRGARAGHLVGVSGSFGHQAAGLLLLEGRAKSNDSSFSKRAIDSVLNPSARLWLGLKCAHLLSSCIDSSDGLAISLYHLAESSKVKIDLEKIPSTSRLDDFAKQNRKVANDLALFGGEEFELVCTFDPRHRSRLSRFGIKVIGSVSQLTANEKPSVVYGGRRVSRSGWVHFKSSLT